jgi:lipoate-protein ligase A
VIIDLTEKDVYTNLATEQWYTDYATGPILLLWQSDQAVVMGKNQNPWRECRLQSMASDGVPLVRRISGGGAVYHDLGNLNYSVIVDRAHYEESRAFDMLLTALSACGIHAERTCKSNIMWKQKKISGTAFAFRKQRVLHHGTLLLHTDLEKMQRYLGSEVGAIETNAIASVPAKTTNIGVEVENIKASLMQAFSAMYAPNRQHLLSVNPLTVQAIRDQYTTDAWLYGKTPAFSLQTDEGNWVKYVPAGAEAPMIEKHLFNADKLAIKSK